MTEWKPIESADKDTMKSVLLWNGEYVFAGSYLDGGWCDDDTADHMQEPVQPQPTHWMPFPEPPHA